MKKYYAKFRLATFFDLHRQIGRVDRLFAAKMISHGYSCLIDIVWTSEGIIYFCF